MSSDQRTRGGFEERLLNELRSMVATSATARSERPRTRIGAPSRRRLALAGGLAALLAVAAGAGVPFLTGGASPAYAVTKNDDGTVTVEISSLGDAAGLERKLRDAGIRAVVQYLPPGKACKQPWPTATPGDHATKGGPEGTAIKGGVAHSEGHTRFTISKNLPADETLVIMTQVGGPSEATGPSSIGITLAHGEVLPCEIVDSPAGSPPFGPPPAGAQLHTETGAHGLSSSGTTAAMP
jgi:hypothetical protein